MGSIVFFPCERGATYYLHRSIVGGREELQLAHAREEASVFEDIRARELAKRFNGSVRPEDWEEDPMKICSHCRAAKPIDDFYLIGHPRYPHLRRAMCKRCDNSRRRGT